MDSSANDFPFLSIYRSKNNPQQPNSLADSDFTKTERYFLNLFEIGLFEVYEFLYHNCTSDSDFKNWLVSLKGESFYEEKRILFNQWLAHREKEETFTVPTILTPTAFEFWEKQGYLHLNNIIPEQDCDEVVALICETLQIDLQQSATWYPQNEKLMGLMLQLYQGKPIEKIRNNEKLFAIFADLYQSNNLIPNCEKVSYNPPETNSFKFLGSNLHWDIDFAEGPKYYIQGLVYLNDVPANRGAFTLVPGFHQNIEKVLSQQAPETAIEEIRKQEKIKYIDGKKGDLILWLQSIPHAASPNNSDCPRFVQYVSFER